jgi:hypothetical protein
LYNRNAIFTGGIRPHFYCLPVLKRETHRVALLHAATSGNPRFFLGTDSAPHAAHLKEHASGCAGCYTALSALELYAEAFEAAGALGRLEAFASFNGRPGENDARDLLLFEGFYSLGDGEIGLAGAGGAEREHEVRAFDGFDQPRLAL